MSYQMVPKYTQALYKSGMRYSPYGRYAQAASFAYRNRDAIANAAKFGVKAARKARSKARERLIANKRAAFSTENVGAPVGTSSTKSATTASALVTTFDTRTLYSFLATDIPQGTNEGERLRRIVNLRGIKVCLEAINLDTEALYLNWALLSPKAGATDIQTTDFFRIQGSERGTDFGIALEGYQFACYPINTDRYTVLKHSRHMLVAGTQSGVTNDLTGSNHTLIEYYHKINRQIRFESTANPESGHIYFVWWCDRVGAAAASLVQTAKIQMGRRVVAYFREPEVCC